MADPDLANAFQSIPLVILKALLELWWLWLLLLVIYIITGLFPAIFNRIRRGKKYRIKK